MKKKEIIAEIANAHQGDPNLAYELAVKAKEAGADAVKFQIYDAEELLQKTHPRFEHFKKQAFSRDIWNSLLLEAKSIPGIKIYADVFGLKALETAVQNEVDGFKVHSSDLGNIHLLRELSKTSKKVFISCGGSTFLEIENAVQMLRAKEEDKELILLHGFQSYPTRIEDSVLNRLETLNKLFGETVSYGYMDHVDADDRFASVLPLMTLPYHVGYIEKHITLNRQAKGTDYYSSLNPDEFEAFVKDFKKAETAFLEKPDRFSEAEANYRKETKKIWVAKRDINVGELLSPDDFIMKRPAQKMETADLMELAGKKIIKSLTVEEPLLNSHVSHSVLAVIVARLDSKRLPRKAVIDLNGRPAISHLFERIKLAKERGYVNEIAFCTTRESVDDELITIAKKYPMKIYRGETENVLSRFMLAVEDNPECDLVLRITGDDLLVDPDFISKTVEWHLSHNADYTDAKALPSGTEVEAFTSQILKLLYDLSSNSSGTEYLTTYITDNRSQFKTASLEVPLKYQKKLRLTLDTREDYQLISLLLQAMKKSGKEFDYTLDDIMDFFDKNPGAIEINKVVEQRKTPLNVNTTLDWKRRVHRK